MIPKLYLLVGPPGSGKTTYATSELSFTTRISQDNQGREGHKSLFQEALSKKEHIVVDRMGFNKQQRSYYLSEAKKHGYETKISVLHMPKEICFERMLKRENHPTIKDSKTARSALNTFFSKYERPTEDEADIVKFDYWGSNKKDALVIDLDGTLCNIDHRLKYMHTPDGKKNWKEFLAHISEDIPNEWCRDIYNQFKDKYAIVFASGRSDDHEKVTREWLAKYDFKCDNLFMRNRHDFRSDEIVKENILDFEILPRFNPIMFIDDRSRVVNMWRRRGFVCLQCAQGDF